MQVVEPPQPQLTPRQDIDRRFTRHRAGPKTGEDMDALFAKGKTLGNWIVKNIPEGRERSLALTHLEQTVFWANAALARNITEDEDR